MPAFQYQNVILHTLPDNQGWQIVGVNHLSNRREVIAILSPVAGEWLAERWADQAAKNLAGKPSAEID